MKSPFLSLCICVACVLLLAGAGCVSIGPGGMSVLSIRKGRAFVIAKTDKAVGWGFLAHSYLMRLDGDRILARCNMAGDISIASTIIALIDYPPYTEDGGQTWKVGDPMEWVDGKPKLFDTEARKGQTFRFSYGYGFGQILSTSGYHVVQQRIVRPTADTNAPSRYVSEGISSEDGRRWKGPFPVPWYMPPEYSNGIALSPRGVETEDGSFYCAAYTRAPTDLRDENLRSTILIKSTNQGASYNFHSYVAGYAQAPWGEEGADEPGLLYLGSNEFLCVMRTGPLTGYGAGNPKASLLQARSTDGGSTWSFQRLAVPGVMPKLLRMKSGILVCAFGRPGNHLMFSRDNGRHWMLDTLVDDGGSTTTGYIDALEVAPNRLLIVFDSYNKPASNRWLLDPPPPVNALWGMFVDVRRLL